MLQMEINLVCFNLKGLIGYRYDDDTATGDVGRSGNY